MTKEDRKELRLASAAKVSKETEKKAARKRKKNSQDITNIDMAARREGMSYGQYVAKYGI